MKKQQTKTFTDEQKLFLKTGYCDHSTLVKYSIPNSDTILTNCKVCGKEFDREYIISDKTKLDEIVENTQGLIRKDLLLN